jgi:hypothetical protein
MGFLDVQDGMRIRDLPHALDVVGVRFGDENHLMPVGGDKVTDQM